MKFILLTSGHIAKVDDDDHERLKEFTWSLFRGTYAIRTKGKRGSNRYIFMHREVLGLPHRASANQITDHINGFTLDNRKCNLRVSDKSGNSANRGRQSNNTSGYKGVVWCQGKWVAQLKYHGRYIYGGRHATKEAAALTYDRLAEQYFGAFALTNKQLASSLERHPASPPAACSA